MPMLSEGHLLRTSASCSQLQLNVCDLNSKIFVCGRETEQLFHSYANQYEKAQDGEGGRKRVLRASQLLTFF